MTRELSRHEASSQYPSVAPNGSGHSSASFDARFVGLVPNASAVAYFHLHPPDKRASSANQNHRKSNRQNLKPTEADWQAYDEMVQRLGSQLKFYIVDPFGGVQEFYRNENGEGIVMEKWPKGNFSWKKRND